MKSDAKQRIAWLDAIRLLACFLVILTHSAMPAENEGDGFYMVIISLISTPSSELFITISGSILLPTILHMKDFYIKRFSKLFFPVAFWSMIIVSLSWLMKDTSLNEALIQLILIPIKPATGVYWFIYVICGLYLFAPIISPWLMHCTKNEIRFLILLWLITLGLPYLNIIMPGFYKIDGNYFFILNYFGGFIGYMLLGFYLRKYPVHYTSKLKLFLTIFFLIIAAILPIYLCYAHNKSLLPVIWNNLSLTSVLLVYAIYIFFQNIKLGKFLYSLVLRIAKYSFGIYLIHVIIVREVIWVLFKNMTGLNPIIKTFAIAILALSVCYFIIRLISLLPKSKYIIGV